MTEERPTIDRLRDIQKNRALGDDHVVYVDDEGFVMAHTDEERATIELHKCPLHTWLVERATAPRRAGYYHVILIPTDGYSSSYRSDGGRWEWRELMV